MNRDKGRSVIERSVNDSSKVRVRGRKKEERKSEIQDSVLDKNIAIQITPESVSQGGLALGQEGRSLSSHCMASTVPHDDIMVSERSVRHGACYHRVYDRHNFSGIWVASMGTKNTKKERLRRLENKNLDNRLIRELVDGLSCSLFEAQMVVNVVKETYLPYFDEEAFVAPPGKITLMAVAADEPAGKPLAECEKVAVCLSIHRGPDDDRLQQNSNPHDFRRARIRDLCQEALSQGGLLTREDLAYHVFFCSPRTISRDLAALREKNPSVPIPLRSIVHDIGPVLTHRVDIVRLALQGKTTTEIRDTIRHSPEAISNYVSTFTRCAQLANKGMEVSQIAFLLHRGKSLVQSYLDILQECQKDPNMAYHLENLLSLGAPSKKNSDGDDDER